MRGLLPLARLARSIVRASSMSSTVWLIWRSKVLAWVSCLLSCVQLPGGLSDLEMALLINVFSVANIINHKASAFQLKVRAVIAGNCARFESFGDARPVMHPRAFGASGGSSLSWPFSLVQYAPTF